MPQIQSVTRERYGAIPPRNVRGNQHDDFRVDDAPPGDHPSERYSAWSATSFYEFVPFSSPAGR